MIRVIFWGALCALAAPLAAFYAQPEGYSRTEYPLASGASGITWDPATGASDFYAHHNGGIRRFDTAGGVFASSLLFLAPPSIPPSAFASFDAMAIDPAAPDDFYVSYSGNFSRLYKLNRTGPDAATVVSFLDYSANGEYVYSLRFVPDLPTVPLALRGQLLAACAIGYSGVAKIYLVNRSTLALTELADIGTTNGSGPFTLDHEGNLFCAVPPSFFGLTGAEIKRFAAVDLAAAVGSMPAPASAAQTIIAASANLWNLTSLQARLEQGQSYLYFGTYEHASLFKMCLSTRETREFVQGFGGVSDGYSHFAQGGGLAFSSAADTFRPFSGQTTTLALPFSVYTPGYGSYFSLFLFRPLAVNATVASLAIVQQPTAVNSGVPFSITVEARNTGGTPVAVGVGVNLSASGAGTLSGFTLTAGSGAGLLIEGLRYTAGALPASFTLTVALNGAAISVASSSIAVVAPATQLGMVAPPAAAQAIEFFSVTVELRDAAGQRVQLGPDAAMTVTAAKVSGPGNLYGQTSKAATSGLAGFGQLLLDVPGSYVLEFSAPGLASVTLSLTVTAPAASGGVRESGGSCTTGEGSQKALLVLLLPLLWLWRRRQSIVQ